MVTGMKKKEKITEIFFDEDNPVINIRTYNTDLKNRLTRFSNDYPDECKWVDDSGNGMLEFEINKVGIRVLSPARFWPFLFHKYFVKPPCKAKALLRCFVLSLQKMNRTKL